MGEITRLDEIRKQVGERVEQEAEAHAKLGGPPAGPTGNDGDGTVSPEFIWECYRANEVGDGTLYAHRQRGKFVHNCDTSGEWYKFNGTCWEVDKNGRALHAVEDVVLLYQDEGRKLEQERQKAKAEEKDKGYLSRIESQIDGLSKRCNRLRKISGRENCLRAAATCVEPLTITYLDLDTNPMLLACGNGVIDLERGTLRPGRPEDFITRTASVPLLDIEAIPSAWEQFLLDCLEDPDVIHYLKKMLGYSITGLSSLRIFPVFYGPRGQNGKGTIMEMLHYVLGSLLAGPIQSEMLIASKNVRSSSGPSPDIMDLKGKRLVWGEETDSGQRFAAAAVKKYTGGGPLVGRNPNDRHQTTFLPTHTMFLLTNEKPHAPPEDNAFWIRTKLFEFPFTFVDREPKEAWERRADTKLGEKLKKEAPAILAWLVRGCLDWQEEGLAEPDKIKNATFEYRRSEDQIQDFLDECCMINPDYTAGATEIYNLFKGWWKENVNLKPLSQKKFGELLSMKFHKDTPRGSVIYYGLGIKSGLRYESKD